MELYAGVDIGGSHLAVGLVNAVDNSILDSRECFHSQDVSPNEIVSTVAKFVQEMKENIDSKNSFPLKGLGVGCPGQAKDGVLVKASNLPKFVNVPLEKMLSEAMNNIPVILLNDADAAISAEVVGNPSIYANYKNIAMVTLGTGIGLGLIIENKLYQGSNGLVEGGHMIVASQNSARKCGCGQSGCIEAYASARTTALRLEEFDTSFIRAMGTDTATPLVATQPLTGKDVFQRYHANEYNAVYVVEETAEHLATFVINLCRVLDPEVIIFGGGLSKAGDVLINLIKKHIERKTWTVLPTDVILRIAQLHEPGLLGTALAAKQKFGTPSSCSSSSSSAATAEVLVEEKEEVPQQQTSMLVDQIVEKKEENVVTKPDDAATTVVSTVSISSTPSCSHHIWFGLFLTTSSFLQYYLTQPYFPLPFSLPVLSLPFLTNNNNNNSSTNIASYLHTSLLLGQLGLGLGMFLSLAHQQQQQPSTTPTTEKKQKQQFV